MKYKVKYVAKPIEKVIAQNALAPKIRSIDSPQFRRQVHKNSYTCVTQL